MAPRPNQDELQRRRAELLDEVMRSHGRQLWRQARRFTSCDADADDALEDACIAFLRYFPVGPDNRCQRWMLTTVKHAAFAISKRAAVRRQKDAAPISAELREEWWESSVPDPTASVEEQVEDRLWVRTCGELLGELKPAERTALSLVAFGLSYREIAARQGWSATKTNRCINEGRARLRELLLLRGEKP
jgi:RNA polymerase sigma factor (sigma-70 family)